jgi:hypothetical protein
MRVSQQFGLGITQPSLGFVDIDTERDTPLFLDPSALLSIQNEWSSECQSLIQHFFQTVLDAIRDGDVEGARDLLIPLSEPNETHLGLSTGSKSRGRGLGEMLAYELVDALASSPAVTSGLLVDLQDTALMVEGVGSDRISDIATNIIREPLIRYTQEVCRFYGIPMESVDSGAFWQPHLSRWATEFVDLPMGPNGKLLFVPKELVRVKLDFSAEEYYRKYLLVHLQQVHLAANSALVTVLRSGEHRVYKTTLEAEYGSGKRAAARLTKEYPNVLAEYRTAKQNDPAPVASHEAFAKATGEGDVDWMGLLTAVTGIESGPSTASDYHRAVYSLLKPLFWPSLGFPRIENEIHEGRKRIDISFTNQARSGFFAHMRDNYIAAYIPIECKNYSADPGNPELDQLSGRFSNLRGWVGVLVCRSMENKALFIKRCRDTALDDRGFVIPLDDDDLRTLVEARMAGEDQDDWESLLRERFQSLI